MLDVEEVAIKLRNKQHHLEQKADELSRTITGGAGFVVQGNLYVLHERESYAQQELQQVKHAILRIKQGTYNECELCLKGIEVNRLLALPYTALCSNCAREG